MHFTQCDGGKESNAETLKPCAAADGAFVNHAFSLAWNPQPRRQRQGARLVVQTQEVESLTSPVPLGGGSPRIYRPVRGSAHYNSPSQPFYVSLLPPSQTTPPFLFVRSAEEGRGEQAFPSWAIRADLHVLKVRRYDSDWIPYTQYYALNPNTP
ncbi:hypothetical protein EYF80_013398 [Liparis tanakae]|uniref:Uncharacterized protein n=1 Tax=Liparis tanakae TaxID=230148 RepID=A0A4Z2IE07_9TELE|nr:hypothetical protein EYF80_013398 [Liparis tanakae]